MLCRVHQRVDCVLWGYIRGWPVRCGGISEGGLCVVGYIIGWTVCCVGYIRGWTVCCGGTSEGGLCVV